MRLLLDTHIVLWSIAEPAKLTRAAVALLEDEGNSLVVSAVVIWEAAIKYARRRGLPTDMPLSGTALLRILETTATVMLPVSPRHSAHVDTLPLLHSDPFDRLLVAQAQAESMHLLTHDAKLRGYGDFVIVA